MTTILFAGPTLRPEEVRSFGAAECLPPVRHGDVYRVASRRRPRAIGIIDGVFQHVPSVWHKEILWAMANGIHVFGAASMGALRAAELHSFGMVGVGRIFEAYRSGALEPYGDAPFEDDDEVAVIHGPPETGYVALSEAMVNIRATLAEAASAARLAAQGPCQSETPGRARDVGGHAEFPRSRPAAEAGRLQLRAHDALG